MVRLESIEFHPLCVDLREPFGIATGTHHEVRNVLVRLVLSDGTVGLGEAAPVPHISGETEAEVVASVSVVRDVLEKLDLTRYREVSRLLAEALPKLPSARAGVETALLDALTRRAGISLWRFFGGTQDTLTTDITIPTGTVEHARSSARSAAAKGFSELKVKVGGSSPEEDVARVQAVFEAAPRATLILDGNTAYSSAQAIDFIRRLSRARAQIVLFEQPVAAADLEGLRDVQQATGIAVAADESLRSRDDLQALVRIGGIRAINIKTAKFGLIEAWDLLLAGRSLGFEVMIGGMVETEISMTTSACLAAGVGGVRYVDLDTPLFLSNSPCTGGFVQTGPRLEVAPISFGHGVAHRAF